MAKDSPTVRDGILTIQEPTGQSRRIVVGSPEWFAWLERASHFVVESLSARFTARKKPRGQVSYWYVPFRRAGKYAEVYLGKSAAVTVEKLRAAVEWLASVGQAPVGGESLTARLNEFLERGASGVAATDAAHIRRLAEGGTSVPSTLEKWGRRAHACEALNEGVKRRLTILHAPPGYGKTTLLAAWISASQVSTAWLTLEAGHNDVERFWSHLCAALDKVMPGLLDRLLPLIPAATSQHQTAFVDQLVACLADAPHPQLLVLDDFHAIRNDNAALLDQIWHLVEQAPSQVHFVVASREHVPFPLARMRAEGQLSELKDVDLAFTPAEIAELLAQHFSLALSNDEIEELYRRTQGWPIAITLTALALTQSGTRERLLNREYNQDRFVFDFVVAEVLRPLPRDLQAHLLQVSVLDRLSAPLCNAVTGRRNGRAMLAELVRRNLFILPLDGHTDWYRLHPLVAQALKRYLSETQPELVHELYARASQWCHANGFVRDAIEYAFASNDPEHAADLLELYTPRAWKYGRVATLRQFIERLPEEVVRKRPRLLLAHANSLILMHDLTRLPRRLREAEQALAQRAEDFTALELATLRSELAALNTYLFSKPGASTAETQVATYEQTLSVLPQDEVTRDVITMGLGIEQFLNGDVRAARATLGDLLAATRSGGRAVDYPTCLMFLGNAHLQSGCLEEVLDLDRRYFSFGTHSDLGDADVSRVLALLRGYVLYERNDLDAVLATLETLLASAEPLTLSPATFACFPLLAFAQQARGNTNASRMAMEKVGSIYQHWQDLAPRPWAWAQDLIEIDRVRLSLMQGEVEPASRLARQLVLTRLAEMQPGGDRSKPSHVRELESMVLARIHLAEGHPQPALEVLGPWIEAAEAAGRVGRLIEMLVLQALAHHALQNREDALRALARAVVLAAPERYVRTFVDAGPMVQVMLADLFLRIATQQLTSLITFRTGSSRSSADTAEEKAILEYIRSLIIAFGPATPDAHPPRERARERSKAAAFIGLVPSPSDPTEPPIATNESLTARELEVLRALACGASNPEIAVELGITEATVKHHVGRILSKLRAQNRTQAVVSAIALGLIEAVVMQTSESTEE